MTKEAIIAEIKKHPPEEQQEIMEAVLEPGEEDYELSDEGKAFIDARWQRMREHPEQNLNYEQLKARLKERSRARTV